MLAAFLDREDDPAGSNEGNPVMPDFAKILSEATVDQLIDELLKRPGIVSSIWNVEDVRSFVDESDGAEGMSDEQKEAACLEFLSRAGSELRDHLGSQGNFKLEMFWDIHGEDILKSVAASAPSA
jgi:hypothetical protein